MAEETDEDKDAEAEAQPPPPPPAPEPVPTAEPPPEASNGANLRVIGIAVAASLATAFVTYGATSLSMSSGERSRADAARADFQTELAAAEQRTAEVRAQLEALHQKQALYVAHTSVVRAMQELDKTNYGSAAELLKHAGEALGAADPAVAGEVRQTLLETQIEVGEDRIGQLNRLREIAKQLQVAMGA